jgi:hypothetical protein
MPRAEKPEILKWICRQTFDRPFQIKYLLALGAIGALGKSYEDAEAYAEANANTFWRYLLTHEQEYSKRGLTRCFEIIDESAMTLSWLGAGVVVNLQSTPQMRTLLRLRHRPAFLKMIDKLNDREYEALGCVISQLGGATEISLTPGGGDGGVDFLARVQTPGHCHLFGGGVHPSRVIGQCKKYNSAISVEKVDAFVTAMQKIKFRSPRKDESQIPNWFHSAKGPIIGLIISHSGFQSGAEELAKNQGILTADTMDLAEIAAKSRKIPESLGAEGRAELCRAKAVELLNKPTGSPILTNP